MDYIFDLQLFADGGAGAGAGGGADGGDGGAAAAAAPEVNPAEQRLPARGKRRENPLANVTYGRQEPAQVQAAEQQGQTESFEELIKGRFKQDFDSRVQGIIQDRLKASKERDAKTNPILHMVAERYGLDADDLDLDALSEKVANDTSQYEAEAVSKGLDVDTVAKIHKLERMEAQQAAQREEQQRQTEFQTHLEGLFRQEQQVKQLYPSFDLQTELQNPQFVRLTAPGVGVDVRTAYEVVHRDEMAGREMQFGAQKAAQRISASVAANARRPAENGTGGSSAAINKSDPRLLTKEDRAEIRRRVRQGEKIIF